MPKKSAHGNNALRIMGVACMSVLLTALISSTPAFAQFEELRGDIKEKTYDTEDGKFRVHYKNVSEDYAKFVGHAFSKAREFQLALGFNDVALGSDSPDSKDGKIAIYVKDLIYDDKATEAVIGQNRLQYMLVSDKPDKFEEWQIYLGAAYSYFMAVQTSYNTLGYQASEDKAWINDGIAKFITLYTALNDPEYKQYDEDFKRYGYLDKVMVEGKYTSGYASYEVPRIGSDLVQQNSITKLGDLSVSYWYYLHKLHGIKVIQDVMTNSGSYNDDSARIVSSVLSNYNATFVQSVAGWYESLGFWNKGNTEDEIGEFSVYEGLLLVNGEVFTEYKSSELPIKIENQLSRYGASLVNLKFNSHGPILQLRFLNPSEAVYLYVYIHNIETDEYYQQQFEVEKGYQDFWVWTENAEINFIVIGGENTFRGGYKIAAV